MKKSNYHAHQILQKTFMLDFQRKFPDARIFPRVTGVFYTRNGIPVKINRPGMSDAYFYWNGLAGEIEFKTGTGKLSEKQENWRDLCHKIGILFILVREDYNMDEIRRLIEEHAKMVVKKLNSLK